MNDLPNAIYLVTGINEAYLSRAEAYIASMNRYSNVHNIVITLDFEMPREHQALYSSVRFLHMSASQVRSPNTNSCMQHGGFLPALDFLAEREIIIYTDADIEMQRPFADAELRELSQYGDDEIGVSFNRSQENWLSEEAGRLKCRVSIEVLTARYPGVHELPTFNTGVLVANHGTYKRLYEAYNEHWQDFQPLFGHYAKQQWLLSYLIQKQFQPRILPELIHTHGHDPLQPRTSERAGFKFCIGSQPVVLNHAVTHPAEERVRRLEKQVVHLNVRLRRLCVVLVALAILCIFLIVRNIL